MISDTLAEAIKEIRRHQREFPEVYDDVKPTVDYTLQKMEALRRYLDEPPTDRQVQAIRRRKGAS
jgi:hypothetical protein